MNNHGISALVVCIALAATLCGCESFRKDNRHFTSSWTGLNRTVTVYKLDGTPLREWSGKLMIEIDSGVVSFIDSSDKEIKIAGGIVIVEER